MVRQVNSKYVFMFHSLNNMLIQAYYSVQTTNRSEMNIKIEAVTEVTYYSNHKHSHIFRTK